MKLLHDFLPHSHTIFKILYSTAVKMGVAYGLGKKMDALSEEAMLTESWVQLSKARVMFWHIAHFFGRSIFESAIKWHKYFGDNNFSPKVDKKSYLTRPLSTIGTNCWMTY